MKHLLSVCAALAVVVSGVNAAQAGLLANAGFESAFVDDGSGVGKWQPFADGSAGNTSEVGSAMPRNGASSAELNLVNPNGFAGFFQDVSANAGDVIDWSVWAKDTTGSNGAGVEMRIEYRDSVGDTEISRTGNLVPASLGSAYEQITLSDVIPAGADTARVVFAIQSFGAAPPQSIFVDDAQVLLNGIPEPTTALLALLGLAPMARRRR